MKYVIDSSVAFKWVVAEAHAGKAVQFREEFVNGMHELIAPDIFPIEIAHALTRAERQVRIPVSQSAILLGDVLATPPVLCPSLQLLFRASEISSQLRVGIYDCLYLALAEREQCEFITADDRLVNVVRKRFPVVPLASLP